MKSLCDTVQSIINAENMEEAENILYGREGIPIDTKAYYESIISRFIRKKEFLIKKVVDSNGVVSLEFDLNNINELYNIIFLATYIKENDELNKAYQQMKIDLNAFLKDQQQKYQKKVKEHKEYTAPEDHARINKEAKEIIDILKTSLSIMTGIDFANENFENFDKIQNFQNIFNNVINALNKKYKKTIEAFNDYNWVTLINSNAKVNNLAIIDKVKQAISIIQKFRNSFCHTNPDLDKMVIINNDTFKVQIPIEYIEGFLKGRIVAKEEDRAIVEITNQIMSPLLKELNYDLSKIESFFYNVDVSAITKLLDFFNNDIIKLYTLNSIVFSNPDAAIELAKQGLDISKISEVHLKDISETKKIIEKFKEAGIELSTVPDFAFKYPDAAIELKEELKKVNINANIDISNMPNDAFKYKKAAKKLISAGIDITNLPTAAFKYPDGVIALKGDVRLDLTKLSYFEFEYPEITKEFIDNGINVNVMDLPEKSFLEHEDLLELIEDKNLYPLPPIAIMHPTAALTFKNKGYDLSKVPFEAYYNFEKAKFFMDKGYDLIKIPLEAYNYFDEAKLLIESHIDITELPSIAFKYPEKLKEEGKTIEDLIEYDFKYPELATLLRKHDINIAQLPEFAFEHFEKVVGLLEAGIPIESINPWDCENSDKIISAIERCKEAGIDIKSLCLEAFYYPDALINIKKEYPDINLSKLLVSAFKYPASFKKLKNAGIDVEKLEYEVAFQYPDILIRLLNKYPTIDITNLPAMFLEVPEMVGKALDLELDITKLSWRLLQKIFEAKKENIEYLRSIVSNNDERLEEFPVEFFSCDISLLDEMLKNYNVNVSRGIFGINNPKIVATIIYFNSVLRKYIKEDNDADLINLNIIAKVGKAGLKYPKLLQEVFMVDEINAKNAFINQFISNADPKSYILDKLRNSAAHFRFRRVRDSAGNYFEDKILLYDEDDCGQNIFNMIIDINDLVNITRDIENGLENKEIEPTVIHL